MLGPLEVTADGRPLGLAGARTRAVLAMLLVRANQVVPSDRLIEELWPGQPGRPGGRQPAGSAVRTAQGAPGGRRGRPAGHPAAGLPAAGDARGSLTHGGSSSSPPRGTWRWRRGDAAAAAQYLDQALGLWRGPALAGLDDAPSVRAEAGRLDEQRLAALESRARGAARLRQAP